MNNYTYGEIEDLNKEIQLIDLTIKKLNHFCSEYSLWSTSDDVKEIINIKTQFRDLMTLMITFSEDLYFFKNYTQKELGYKKSIPPMSKDEIADYWFTLGSKMLEEKERNFPLRDFMIQNSCRDRCDSFRKKVYEIKEFLESKGEDFSELDEATSLYPLKTDTMGFNQIHSWQDYINAIIWIHQLYLTIIVDQAARAKLDY